MPLPASPSELVLARFPDSRRRDFVRLALHFWREGDAEICASHHRANRLAYEQAIAVVLGEMRDLATMEQLLTHYLFERRRLSFLTERACRSAAPSTCLSRIWVRDAAFWRRLCQQLECCAGGHRLTPPADTM